MSLFFQRSLVAAAACGSLSVAWAQSVSASADALTTQLQEVTITAQPLNNASVSVPAQQLSGSALAQRLGSTLGETLDNLPGIANSSFGPNVGRPVIRGLDGDRIRILQNSGANMDVSGLSFDHAVALDPLTTERIEVLRGPATLLYGGSAIGGVVNVIDNRIARERTFDAQGGVLGKAELRAGGAAQERSSGALVEAGNDKFVLHVDAMDRSTRNLSVPKRMDCTVNGVTTTQRRVCNSASDAQGSAVGGTLLLRRHQVMEGAWRDAAGLLQALKFQWGHTSYSHTEYLGSDTGTRFDNGGHELRLEATPYAQRWANGMQLQGVVGVQREGNQLTVQGDEAFVPPSRTVSNAVFTHQVLSTDWGQLSAGARAESVSVYNQATGLDKRFSPFSVAVGGMRNLRQGEAQNGWQLSSQRAPKDYELFANGPHAATGTFEVGNANSAIERATQVDLGGEWKNGPHKASVTGFVSDFANYLSLQATGSNDATYGLPIYAFEGVRARLVGMESSATLRMVGGSQALWSADASRGAMDLALRADFVRADDLTHNRPMPRIAPMRVGADWVWADQAWGARFGFTHAGTQTRVSQAGDVTTAGYTLWNAGVNYQTRAAGTRWMLFAKLDNLTNQLAYSSTSVLTQTMGSNAPPLAGRSVKLGLQASF
jgi:iron complex outermembrane receptor protein